MNKVQGSLVWVPDPQDVFIQGHLLRTKIIKNKQNQDEEIGIVKLENKEVEFFMKDISCVNPNSFDKVDDMSELTHLNEASVLYNLENRYKDDLIYTYSGLFLVAINPYATVNIYTQKQINMYSGSKREEHKPHIFAIAEKAYQNLLIQKKDQSILVTGESGAGKTENTKKILQYLASITTEESSIPNNHLKHESFERKILQSNPILESFGNAQTVRNNNSSRFGKFIKIEFDELGKINGAHIEWYLLEKSRIIHQHSKERNYHIFYQLLSGYSKQELKKLELLSNLVKDYNILKNLNSSIPGIDDAQDFQELLSAFNIVGFTSDEVENIFKCVALILHIGNVEFVSEKSEQASIKSDISPLCRLLGVQEQDFKTSILQPRSKAGKEWVSQSKNAKQSRFILNSLARSLYESLFSYIVKRINESLDHGSMTSNYIGLLDIAGFEIFKDNAFEQLCINYTNEKLQQFFNHHMFVLEQDEYLKENIQWNFIDYGKDLQSTIDLIEKKNQPPGVLSLLDEESMLPKPSDESFYVKLLSVWDSSSPKFKRSKRNQCFVLKHYAGDVEYHTKGWLAKNKDPLNENLLDLLRNSSNLLISEFFVEKIYNSSFRTASTRHRVQLSSLLDQLSSTNPHFVRCIIPNNKKRAKYFDKKAILDQLRCNGVLEGIRIAREGYPNRIIFKEFFQRYNILTDNHKFAQNFKKNSELILSSLHLDPSVFKVGNKKLFFKAGVLADLESRKEEKISNKITILNSIIHGNHVRNEINQQLGKLRAARILSITFKTYNKLMKDPWYNLYIRIKPLINSSQDNIQTKRLSEKMKKIEEELEETKTQKERLKETNIIIENELNDLKGLLTRKTEQLKNHEILLRTSQHRQNDLESNLKEIIKLKDSLITEKEKATEELNIFKVEIEKLKDKSIGDDSTIKGLESEKMCFQSDLINLQNQLDSLKKSEKEIDGHRNDLEQEVIKLKQQVNKKQNSIEYYEKKLKETDTELNVKLKALEKSFATTSKRLTSFVDENKDLKSQISILKNENTEIIRQLNVKKNDLDRLTPRMEQQQQEIQSLVGEKDILVNDHEVISNELKELRKEVSNYKERQQSLEDECDLLKKTIDNNSINQVQNENSDALFKMKEMEDDLLKERSMNKFLNEKLLESSYKTTTYSDYKNNFSGNIDKSYDDMQMKLNDLTYNLEKEINEKKDLISRLRFTETRLASTSFDNQTINAQLKRLKEMLKNSFSAIDIENELENVDHPEFNHEKLLLEIDCLKRQLFQERHSRQDAENVASILHNKFKQIQRSNSTSEIFKLKYEASEERVKSLETKLQSTPLKDRTNSTNGEIFKHRESISKYEDELKFLKLDNYTLRELLEKSEKQFERLTHEFNRSKKVETVLKDQISQIEQDLLSTEKQKQFLQSSAKHYQIQYENCINDLHSTEAQISDLVHSLKQSEEDIQTMSIMIQNLRTQNKQKDKELWEYEIHNNELELNSEESSIELKKVQSANQVLQSKLSHLKELLRVAEDNTEYLEEIKRLKSDLDISLRVETDLKKEISNLEYQFQNLKLNTDSKVSDLLKQVQNYEKLAQDLDSQKSFSETTQKELESQLYLLRNQHNFAQESVNTLQKEKEQLEREVGYLKTKLQDSNIDFENSLKKTQVIANDMDSLRETLIFQQQQNDLNEGLVKKMQEDMSLIRVELSEEKQKGIELYQENQSLGKSNLQLRGRIETLENHLSNTSEKETWFTKIHDLETQITEESELKFEEMKKNKNLERILDELEMQNAKQANVIAVANKDKEEFEGQISQYSEQSTGLKKQISKQKIIMKKMERDNIYYKDRISELEKEIDLWQERYRGISSQRQSLSQTAEEVFV